jgi:tyrosine-protein phosphatase OCA6
MSVAVPALIPPFRFSTVQEGLYRGSYPTLKNFRFLKRLQLKTIVSVVPEPPTSDLAEFCAGEKILNYHFYAEKFTSDNVTVSPATVGQIIQLLVRQENLPLYLHCLDGANVTGIIIMVLRKLQNWTKVATVSEFCRCVACPVRCTQCPTGEFRLTEGVRWQVHA